jgi:hypothetical protein
MLSLFPILIYKLSVLQDGALFALKCEDLDLFLMYLFPLLHL